MRKYWHLAPLGLALLMLAGCAAQPTGPAAQGSGTTSLAAVPALQPDMGRVWILRQRDVETTFEAADPAVFIDNVDLGHIAQGTVFYRDIPPGTYRFRVQPYGTPTHVVDTVQFGPGVTGFLQVQEVPNWEQGSTYSGRSFTVLTMVPQDAEVAIPTLTFLGRR
jgi:hypothetical protein